MKKDLLAQAYSAMRHDLRRTVLTMLGMAWGIATVVLLLAYGEGFGQAIQNIFESFGAKAVGVYPGRTSQQAGGNKAGVQIKFTQEDVEMLRNVAPLIRHVSRQSQKDTTVQNAARAFTFPVIGTDPSIQEIWNLDIDDGRFLNDEDNMEHGHVAVLGSEAKEKLFSGMNPLGETVRLNGVSFQVVGVVHPQMQEGDNDNNRRVYIPYNSMDTLKDTHYIDGIWLDFEGLEHEKLTKTIRESLAAAHSFKPDDQRAIFIFDAQKQLAQFDIISTGLKILLAFIGTITLGIGGVGLMNIMLVSVTQRTREIGVEKALGATRRAHPVSVSGGGDGDHRRGWSAGNHHVVCDLIFGGLAHAVQCDGFACRGRGYPAGGGAEDAAGGDDHPGRSRRRQRHVSGVARGESRSD